MFLSLVSYLVEFCLCNPSLKLGHRHPKQKYISDGNVKKEVPGLALQSNQVKHTPQDCINELII